MLRTPGIPTRATNERRTVPSLNPTFQFEVKFKDTVAMGYGPYIELYLPAKGADSCLDRTHG